MNNTMTTKVFTRTTEKGNTVVVFRERALGHNGVFIGGAQTVRAFAECNGETFELNHKEPLGVGEAVRKMGW